MYKLYKNFLSPTEVNKIHDTIFNYKFPWFYAQENTINNEDLKEQLKIFTNLVDYFQLCHILYLYEDNNISVNSDYHYLADTIAAKINKKIIRSKVNLQGQYIKANEHTFNCPHRDMDEEHLAGIYYVNDSDGFTFLFDNDNKVMEKIMPQKGSLLLFDGAIKHASGHPVKSLKRCVINFNFEKCQR